MSVAYDDEPVDRHVIDCSVWVSNWPCDCGADGHADLIDGPMGAFLRPDAGSLADRLEQLARTVFPRAGDAA